MKQSATPLGVQKPPGMDPTDDFKKRANMHVFLTLLFFVLLAPLGWALSGRTFWLGARSKDWLGARSKDGGSATMIDKKH